MVHHEENPIPTVIRRALQSRSSRPVKTATLLYFLVSMLTVGHLHGRRTSHGQAVEQQPLYHTCMYNVVSTHEHFMLVTRTSLS